MEQTYNESQKERESERVRWMTYMCGVKKVEVRRHPYESFFFFLFLRVARPKRPTNHDRNVNPWYFFVLETAIFFAHENSSFMRKKMEWKRIDGQIVRANGEKGGGSEAERKKMQMSGLHTCSTSVRTSVRP